MKPRLDQEFLKSLTVLYVEDEEGVRVLYTKYLNDICGKLITAVDGSEGFEAYLEHKPNIVITDIQMPGLDGLSLSKKIHELDASIPVIICTGYENMDYLIRASVVGVEKYLTKPFKGEQLITCLLECARMSACRVRKKDSKDRNL